MTVGYELPLLLLSLYGFAWAISQSHLTYGLRTWLAARGFMWTVTLLECCACFGFWEGLGWGLATRSGFPRSIAFGFVVTASNLVLNSIVTRGEKNA